LGQRAREGARSEKLLAHGRLQTPPRPRRALPPHPLQPPRRLRIAASAEVSGVSGILRAGLFDLGTNQHCRWLFFVRRRVMGHCDDISAARRRGLCLEALGCVWANLQGAAAVVRCLGCRIINIGCETHRANAPVPQAREPPSGGPPLGRRLVSSPFTHDKFARSSFLLSFLLCDTGPLCPPRGECRFRPPEWVGEGRGARVQAWCRRGRDSDSRARAPAGGV
jgi:hypothetical protein